MPRQKKYDSKDENDQSLLQKIQSALQLDQSYLSLALGLVIVLIAGFLVFNYFRNNTSNLGPAQQSDTQTQADVEPGNLPGKYTIKEGDTLFSIAQKYYNDGYKYTQIATANKIDNVNTIAVGQVLDIPKLEDAVAAVSTTVAPTPTESGLTPTPTEALGTGGADNQSIWGEKITGDTYTIVEGDWLSKIAGRAYGDIMTFDKIAQANNISNPDVIEPGVVLKIPR